MYWWWDDVLSCTFHVPFQYCFVSATVRGPKCVPPQGSWSTLDEYRKMWKQWRCSAGTVTDTIGQNEPWRRVYLLEDVGTSKPLPTNCGHSLMRVVQKKYTYIYIISLILDLVLLYLVSTSVDDFWSFQPGWTGRSLEALWRDRRGAKRGEDGDGQRVWPLGDWDGHLSHLFFYIYIYTCSAPPPGPTYIYIYYIYVTRDPFRSSQTSRRTQERYPPEALGILGFLTTNPGIPHLKTI